MQAQEGPTRRDREAGDRPAHLAGTGRQAVPQCKAQHQVGRVVHQVIEIDAVQADRAPPAGDLAIDVVEPEAQVGQHDSRHEQRAISRADRHGGGERSAQGGQRHLMRSQAEPDRQPAAVNGGRTGDLPRQPVADLAMPVFLHAAPSARRRSVAGGSSRDIPTRPRRDLMIAARRGRARKSSSGARRHRRRSGLRERAASVRRAMEPADGPASGRTRRPSQGRAGRTSRA